MSQRSPFNKRNMPTSSEEKSASSGMARKSAASAKPAREAAGSVRTIKVTKDKAGFTKTSGMTKEEKKKQRDKERAEDDEVFAVSDLILKHNENYHKQRRFWWVFIGVGVVCVIVSFALSYMAGAVTNEGAAENFNTPLAYVSIAFMILAYVGIFGALIWDFVKVRPIRDQTQDMVRSMSQKRRARTVEECNAMDEAKKAAKDAKKNKGQAAESAEE